MLRHFDSSRDLTRTVLGVGCIAALILSSAWILSPFLPALLWAATIVISTWPLLLRVHAGLGQRRGLATAVMAAGLLLIVLIPLGLSIGALIDSMNDVVAKVNSLDSITIPPPPDWVARIPVWGPKLSAEWQRLSAEGFASIAHKVMPYVGGFVQWLAGRVGGMGAMLLQFLLTVIIAAVLYLNGEAVARGVRMFAYRLAGAHGERAAIMAASTVRGVAKGVMVTAIVQSVIAGIGLVLAGVPGAGLLTAAVFVCSIAQLGPVLVMLPVVVWKFYGGHTMAGIILLIFLVALMVIDNFLRPYLIRQGADLPMLLIIAGVIGGMISFGVMGIFVGPVLLAVSSSCCVSGSRASLRGTRTQYPQAPQHNTRNGNHLGHDDELEAGSAAEGI